MLYLRWLIAITLLSPIFAVAQDSAQSGLTAPCPVQVEPLRHWYENGQRGYDVRTVDLSGSSCVTLPTSLLVRNGAHVTLHLKGWDADACPVSATFKADDKPDLLDLTAGILKAAAGIKAGLAPETPKDYLDLYPEKDGTTTVTFACSKTVRPPAIITVHYTNGGSRFSGSGGALISLMGKRNYGNITSETASGAPVTTKTVFGVKDTSKVQFVPMGFFNVRGLGHGGTLHGDLQVGAGINPNGSKVQVEYFVGPALGLGRLLISPGLHIAKAEYPDPSSSFKVGDVLPSGTTVPTIFRTTLRFAFSISFVPKVSSK